MNKINRKHFDKNKFVRKQLIKEIEPYEKEFGIKPAPIIHLRMATLFLKLKNEKSENLKHKLISIVNEYNPKPKRKLLITIGFSLINFFVIIGIYITSYQEPNLFLSVAGLLITVSLLILGKRYILAILLGILLSFVYIRMPVTVMYYILLINVLSIIQLTYSKQKKKISKFKNNA